MRRTVLLRWEHGLHTCSPSICALMKEVIWGGQEVHWWGFQKHKNFNGFFVRGDCLLWIFHGISLRIRPPLHHMARGGQMILPEVYEVTFWECLVHSNWRRCSLSLYVLCQHLSHLHGRMIKETMAGIAARQTILVNKLIIKWLHHWKIVHCFYIGTQHCGLFIRWSTQYWATHAYNCQIARQWNLIIFQSVVTEWIGTRQVMSGHSQWVPEQWLNAQIMYLSASIWERGMMLGHWATRERAGEIEGRGMPPPRAHPAEQWDG